MNIGSHERRLIDAAARIIRRLYRAERHEIGAALRTRRGRIYTAVNIETTVRNCSLCAEWGAIAQAVARNDADLECIVAVKYFPDVREIRIVPPCGICREVISDFGNVSVIYRDNGSVRKTGIHNLIPSRYSRNKKS